MLVASIVIAAAITAVVVKWRPSPQQSFQSGLQSLEQGDLDRVDDAIDALRDESAFDSHRRVLQAGVSLQRGKPQAALKELALVQPEGDFAAPALLFAGEAFYQVGRLREAEQVFLKYDRIYPDSPEVYRWLAAIYYDLGAMTLAIERLETLKRLAPDDFAPHRLLGVIHVDFERYALAVTEFQEALKRSPPEPVRRSMTQELAKAMMRERRYADALAVLAEARPDAETLARRSECLWSLGRRDEARHALESAVKYEPDKPAVLRWQALMLIDDSRLDEAQPVLERLLEQDPHNLEARYQLAQVYQRSGNKEAHDAEMARLERSNALLGELTRLSHEALERPHDAGLRDQMAAICDELNRPELAASWRRMAASLRESQKKASGT